MVWQDALYWATSGRCQGARTDADFVTTLSETGRHRERPDWERVSLDQLCTRLFDDGSHFILRRSQIVTELLVLLILVYDLVDVVTTIHLRPPALGRRQFSGMYEGQVVGLLFVMTISFSGAFMMVGRAWKSPLVSFRHGMKTSRPCSGSQFTTADEHFMKLALRHAQHAARDTEVPVGAVVVDSSGTVLAASRNRVEANNDATAHAEIEAMRDAAQLQGSWRLTDCTVYSTLEPCPMCLAAMQSFRVKRLVYGAKDTRLGACGSFVNLAEAKHPFHSIEISGGLFAESSEGLLKRFFQGRRVENRSSDPDGGDWTRSGGRPEAGVDVSQREPALIS